MNFPVLVKSKTFWTGVLSIVGAGAAFAMNEISASVLFQTVVQSLLGIFLRNAISYAPGVGQVDPNSSIKVK
jgi:hypothetical protein